MSTSSTRGPPAGLLWVYFSDPDGLALELNHVDYYHKDERAKAASAEYLRSRPSLAEVEARLAWCASPPDSHHEEEIRWARPPTEQ